MGEYNVDKGKGNASMEIIYAIFYTLGIMLLINHFEETICACILRLKGLPETEAEVVGFGLYSYNRNTGSSFRWLSLVKVKYQFDSEEHTRFIYRDHNDWLHDKIKVRIHPKTGCVARCRVRRTYYNCSNFTKNLNLILVGIGWSIDIGMILFALWMIVTHDGSLLFVFLYSLIVTTIGILVSYPFMMGEQKKIDKHGFTL